MFHSRALLISVFAMALPLVSACGDAGSSGTSGEGGDDGCEPNCGQGGDDNPATDTTTVGPGQGGGSTTTTGGGTCTPTFNNDCSGAESCTCGDFEFGAPPGNCPSSVGNTCSPGHNQCGCDMPLNQDYAPPDEYCSTFVNGDNWQDTAGNEGTLQSDWTPSGQLRVGLGAIAPGMTDAQYYHGFIMTSLNLYWNLSDDMLRRCEGAFATGCETITMRCYTEGQSVAAYEETFYHLSH